MENLQIKSGVRNCLQTEIFVTNNRFDFITVFTRIEKPLTLTNNKKKSCNISVVLRCKFMISTKL